MTGGAGEEDDLLDPEHWFTVPNVCGSCIAWKTGDGARPDDKVATGRCQLRPELGRVPGSLKKCDRYMQRGGFSYQPSSGSTRKRSKVLSVKVTKRNEAGEEVTTYTKSRPSRPSAEKEKIEPAFAPGEYYERRNLTELPPAKPFPRAPAPKTLNLGDNESVPLFRAAVVELIRHELGRSRRELHPRFKGGRVIAKPSTGPENGMSVERFFVLLDRLKSTLEAFEQAAEAQKEPLGELSDEIVKSLRAAQGSLTTFNVLYGHREDYFTSQKE